MKPNFPWLLDGGLSNQLESQGCNLNDKLWSAKMIIDNPEAITAAHLAYLKVGVHCIITSSYQATLPGFMGMGYTYEQSKAFLLKTVKLAENAIEQMQPQKFKPLIAASIGPYGAYLADGSEYNGDYNITDEALYNFHKERIDILDNSHADFFACETIPSLREAKILASILKDTKKEAWISFSCKDGFYVNNGDTILACGQYLSTCKNIFAVGINCTKPIYIADLIMHLKTTLANKKIVVYPNNGQNYDAITKKWTGFNSAALAGLMAEEWLKQGASIIGGCCHMGPEHIKAIGQTILAT